jgi:hypothetical protein
MFVNKKHIMFVNKKHIMFVNKKHIMFVNKKHIMFVNKNHIVEACVKLEVDTAAVFFAGVKNCTDSEHKFLQAFLLCYESVQFFMPAKQLAAVSVITLEKNAVF